MYDVNFDDFGGKIILYNMPANTGFWGTASPGGGSNCSNPRPPVSMALNIAEGHPPYVISHYYVITFEYDTMW